MTITAKKLSSSRMAKRNGISRPNAWLFMHKVGLAMKSCKQNTIVETVYINEFIYQGKENLKQQRS